MRTDLEEGLRHAQHASLCLTSFSRRMGHLEDAIERARAEDAETALWLDGMLSRTYEQAPDLSNIPPHAFDRNEGEFGPWIVEDRPPINRQDEL
jgi:hypothetical protein